MCTSWAFQFCQLSCSICYTGCSNLDQNRCSIPDGNLPVLCPCVCFSICLLVCLSVYLSVCNTKNGESQLTELPQDIKTIFLQIIFHAKCFFSSSRKGLKCIHKNWFSFSLGIWLPLSLSCDLNLLFSEGKEVLSISDFFFDYPLTVKIQNFSGSFGRFFTTCPPPKLNCQLNFGASPKITIVYVQHSYHGDAPKINHKWVWGLYCRSNARRTEHVRC